MIPLKKDVEVVISDEFDTSDYSMNATAEAFAATIDTLYTDKVLSPLREYMTNAADAHVEADHTEDFEVKLPTALEPTVTIRDKGPGLSHEQILSHMTCLFSSSKGQTNKQTGYLGLGSKSVFAYTDAATLKSRHKGTERTYFISRADSGTPRITLTSENPTTEPDGFEISYAVKPTDVNAFKEAASWLKFGFKGFPVQPKFNMAIEPTYAASSLKYSTDQVELYQGETGSGKTGVYVRQGPVLYPISVRPEWLGYYGTLLVINVPIGTVAVATSREALSMDDKTTAKINKIITDTKQHIIDSMEKEVAQAASFAEACMKYHGKYTFFRGIQPKYQGKDLTSYAYVDLSDGLTYHDSPSSGYHTYSRMTCYWNQFDNYRFYYFEKDEETPIRSKKRWDEELERLRVSHPEAICRILRGATKANLAKMQKEPGFSKDQFIKFSSIPDPGPTPRKPSLRPKVPLNTSKQLKPYVIEKHGFSAAAWSQVDVPADGEYYWLPVSKKCGSIEWKTGQPGVGHGTDWFCSTLQSMVSYLSAAYVSKPMAVKPILLMTATVQKQIKPEESKRLDKAISVAIKANLDEMKGYYLNQFLQYGTGAGLSYDARSILLTENLLVITPLKRPQDHMGGYGNHSHLAQMLTMVDALDDTVKANEAFLEQLRKDYPLLFSAPSERELLKNYILLVKEANKQKTRKGNTRVKI